MIEDKFLHRELSESIVGACMRVLNTLRPGLSERAYENALVVELGNRGHVINQQSRYDVHYEGVLVDTIVPDLIVGGNVIVDTKVVEEFNNTHIAQMMGYLAITNLQLAILANFKHADFRWRRVIR